MKRRVIEWEDWAGSVEAVLEAVPDQRVIMCRNTATIAREARRCGLWDRLACSAAARRQILLADTGGAGVEFFAWIDKPKPGGYLWVFLPGAKEDSEAFAVVRDWIMTSLGWHCLRPMRVLGS